MEHSIEINLRLGTKKDFVKYAGKVQKQDKNNNLHTINKYVPRHGTPYWLINSKGEIEKENYIFTENTDTDEFKNYLIREQVLVLNEKTIK